jgi:hypothetical protein
MVNDGLRLRVFVDRPSAKRDEPVALKHADDVAHEVVESDVSVSLFLAGNVGDMDDGIRSRFHHAEQFRHGKLKMEQKLVVSVARIAHVLVVRRIGIE